MAGRKIVLLFKSFVRLCIYYIELFDTLKSEYIALTSLTDLADEEELKLSGIITGRLSLVRLSSSDLRHDLRFAA